LVCVAWIWGWLLKRSANRPRSGIERNKSVITFNEFEPRRELRPACIRLELPLITWHSFRHTHATLLGEVGESLRTAQAILGHSDLKTTLNVYTHAIPESQRRAVDKVAGVLFPNVPKFDDGIENRKVN
jgi:integrase